MKDCLLRTVEQQLFIIILHPEQSNQQFLQIVDLIDVFREQNQDITHLMYKLIDNHLHHPQMDDKVIFNLSRTMLMFVSSMPGQKAQDDATPEQVF